MTLPPSTQRVSLVQPPVDQLLRQGPEGFLDSVSRLGAGLVHTQDLVHKVGVLQHLLRLVLAEEPFGLVLQVGFAADDDDERVVVAVSLRLRYPPFDAVEGRFVVDVVDDDDGVSVAVVDGCDGAKPLLSCRVP